MTGGRGGGEWVDANTASDAYILLGLTRARWNRRLPFGRRVANTDFCCQSRLKTDNTFYSRPHDAAGTASNLHKL